MAVDSIILLQYEKPHISAKKERKLYEEIPYSLRFFMIKN